MGSRSGEAVPVKGLPALYLSVVAPLLVQSSSATLPNLSRPQLWSSHLAGAHERQAFDHRCGRVAKLALKRRRVQQRCPRAPTPEPGKGRRPKNRRVAKLALERRRVQQRCPRAPTPEPGKGRRPKNRRVAKLALKRRRVQQRCPRAPTPEPGKGRRPKNRQSQRRYVSLPGCSVFSLSWPACAGAFLVPGRWFFGPAPSGSCLFLFRLMFLSTGRGRHVPAPSGRDVGSSAGAPTKEPAPF